MTIETVLTDEQIGKTYESMPSLYHYSMFARAIEQSVLQSPDVQAWKKDEERYRFLRSQNLDDGTDTTPWISAASTDDDHWGLSGEIADSRIDAAMEKQP